MSSIFRRWLPLAFIAVLASGLSFVSAQQVLRQDANDPQIQLAEDVAAAMNAGATSADIVPQTPVDMSKSLAPFVLIYDKDNKVSGSDAVIGAEKPEVPAGVLNVARDKGSNRVSWEPKSGVRSALVAMKTNAGDIVVVGRSLREIELRERQQLIMSAGVLGVALLGSFLLMMLLERSGKKTEKKKDVTSEEKVAPEPTTPSTDMPHTHVHHDEPKSDTAA